MKGREMKRQPILYLMISLLGAASVVAQPRGVTDIRKVDFLNFTYGSSLCSQEYGKEGIGKTVLVHDGEFKNKNVYFAVAGDGIIYADVTGDGREDAIVPVDCGAITANFSLSEIYVYTIKDERATLLADISDKDLERDYRRHYPDAESYWGINEGGLKVKDGHLVVDVLADGSHASPQYIVTLEYGLSGKTLRLIGKPERRSFKQ
jgi:hypothetical protein